MENRKDKMFNQSDEDFFVIEEILLTAEKKGFSNGNALGRLRRLKKSYAAVSLKQLEDYHKKLLARAYQIAELKRRLKNIPSLVRT